MDKRHPSTVLHWMRAGWLAPALAAFALGGLAGCGERVVSFSDHVQPILDKRCIECHVPGAEGYEASGLQLTSYESLMRGTRYGPIIEPGDPLISVLNQLVEGRADPSIAMPHGGQRLPDSELKLLRNWVSQGARNN